MFAWIADNAVTIVTILVVGVIVALALISVISDKKKHKGCTGNCATCGMACPHIQKKK